MQQTLDAITSAFNRRDRHAFDASLSRRDPAFAPVAAQLYGNVLELPMTRLEWEVQGPRLPVSRQQHDVLGEDAWRQSVRVRWQLTGERYPAEHRVVLTFCRDGSAVVLADTRGPTPDGGAAPLWWSEPVTARSSAGVVVLGAPGAAMDRWSARLRVARDAVRDGLPPDLRPGADTPIVLELPSSRQSFARVLGGPVARYATIAGVAWPMGPDPARAAIHVILNPAAVAPLDEAGRLVLLTHEAVHALTRSAASPAPLWLVEGMAEVIAYDRQPGARRLAEAELRRAVRDHGVSSTLPPNQDFRPDNPNLSRTYGQAWSVADHIDRIYGRVRLGRLYRELDRGATLAAASRSALGVTETALVAGWRRDLARQSSS